MMPAPSAVIAGEPACGAVVSGNAAEMVVVVVGGGNTAASVVVDPGSVVVELEELDVAVTPWCLQKPAIGPR
jgi:hypothetical protein